MQVTLVTPEEEIFTGAADLVIARSPEGEFGIMRNHIPFLATLIPGLVHVVSGGDRTSYVVSGGFLEASRGYLGEGDEYHVIVLADDAEEAGDIDATEAKRRIQDSKRQAEESRDDRAEAELAAALARPQLGKD
ncbi:MAG: ATP synthase F1 subunit epsilon [Actinomycetota bacterium]